MRGRLRTGLMRLPGGVGYRLATALHLRRSKRPETHTAARVERVMPTAPPAEPETNPYTHALAQIGAQDHAQDAAGLPAALAPADRHVQQNGTDPSPDQGPLTVQLERKGRQKRLRVRAAGDIWSDDFRNELARDRHFEATLVWKEFFILVFIAIVLAARTFFG